MSYVRKRNDDYYTAGFDKCQGFFQVFSFSPVMQEEKGRRFPEICIAKALS